MADASETVSRTEFLQLATGVRAVAVMFALALAIYNALTSYQLYQIGDTVYGKMFMQVDDAPWVFSYRSALLVCSALLPLAAGVLGLRLKNHLHALTAVVICLILMLLQMHLVVSSLVSPLMNLLNGVSKAL